MQLFLVDMATIQLIILPLYILITCTGFLVHFFKRKLLQNATNLLHADNTPLYDINLVAVLLTPLTILLVAYTMSFRFNEGFFCLAQAQVFAPNVRALHLLLAALLVNVVALQTWNIKTTQAYLLELFVFIIWLFFSYFWLTLVTSLIAYLFFIEIFGLLFLIISLYIFLATQRGIRMAITSKNLFNAHYSGKLMFVQAFLFFFWTSAVAMIILIWSCTWLVDICASLSLTAVDILLVFELSSSTTHSTGTSINAHIPGFLFLVALLFKSAAIPAQAWLLTFYKHLSLPNLVLYFQLYYAFFLVIMSNLILHILNFFLPIWLLTLAIATPVTLLFAVASIGESQTIRGLLAFSSVLNITLLLTTLFVI